MDVTLIPPNGNKIAFQPVFNAPGILGNFGLPRMDRNPAGPYASMLMGATFVSGTSEGREWTSEFERKYRRSPKGWHPPWLIGFETAEGDIVTAEDEGVSFWELLRKNHWQERRSPFLISFRPKGTWTMGRRENTALFAQSLATAFLGEFRTNFGILFQFHCGNAIYGTEEWLADAFWQAAELQVLRDRGVPIVGRFDSMVPTEVLRSLEPYCDGFWIADGIPWQHYGNETLRKRDADGGFPQAVRYRLNKIERLGVLFGPKYLDQTIQKVEEARRTGIQLPIIAGNGIRTANDVLRVKGAGAEGIVADLSTVLKSPEFDRVIASA